MQYLIRPPHLFLFEIELLVYDYFDYILGCQVMIAYLDFVVRITCLV